MNKVGLKHRLIDGIIVELDSEFCLQYLSTSVHFKTEFEFVKGLEKSGLIETNEIEKALKNVLRICTPKDKDKVIIYEYTKKRYIGF